MHAPHEVHATVAHATPNVSTGCGEQLVLADSFRVRINEATGFAEVRGLHHHVTRFTRGALEIDASAALSIGDFIASTYREISVFGEGFPRWEFWRTALGKFEPRLSLRPLPDLGGSLTLKSVAAVSPPNASRKGPNIANFAALNQTLGAEALLTDANGVVREGATTSLVWWRDGRPYCSATIDRIDSVTETLLGETLLRESENGWRTGHSAAPLQPANIRTTELAQHEVWAVNALHGIRVVTAIDGLATLPPDTLRLAHFKAALDKTWVPFTTAEAPL